jgi:hypothetical protein
VRHGYFIADAEDSRPGALVFNRIVELPDALQCAEAGPSRPPRPSKAPAARPAPSPAQFATGSLSEERVRRARRECCSWQQRYDYYVGALGLAPEQADVLTGDLAVAHFFDAALAVHDNPKAIANWVANEVLRELKGKRWMNCAFAARTWASWSSCSTPARSPGGGQNSLRPDAGRGRPPAGDRRRLGLDQALGEAS